MELFRARLILFSLLVCLAPFSAVAYYPFSAPGTYPSMERYPAAKPSVFRPQQPQPYMDDAYNRSRTGYFQRSASHRTAPQTYYQGYRFRPFQPVTYSRSSLQPYKYTRYQPPRWRPIENPRYAYWSASRMASTRPNTMLRGAYGHDPYAARAAWQYQRQVGWNGNLYHNRYSFRPLEKSITGALTAESYYPNQRMPTQQYRYRPIASSSGHNKPQQVSRLSHPEPSRVSAVTARYQPMSKGEVGMPGFTKPVVSATPKYAPSSANLPAAILNNPPYPLLANFRPMRGYPYHRFTRHAFPPGTGGRPLPPFPSPYGWMWDVPHQFAYDRYSYPEPVMGLTSPNYSGDLSQQTDFGESWYDGRGNREGAWYGNSIQVQDWPQVSQQYQQGGVLIEQGISDY